MKRYPSQNLILNGTGQWSSIIDLTLVPIGAANLPNGKILFWSAKDRFDFGGSTGRTYTTIFDPATNLATERLVTETGHDMFCPGTANLADGRVLISGGSNSINTSIYNAEDDSWQQSQNMNIGRGYHANTVLSSGDVLTIGGSWSGGEGSKHAEVWSESDGWVRLTGLPVTPIIDGINDPLGIYRNDNHAWLWTAPNEQVFHAGPAAQMHWLNTSQNGSYTSAGARGDDASSITGTTVMYDVGKLLKAGGAPSYSSGNDANSRTYTIDINQPTPLTVRQADLDYSRTMHNSVVLPNGEVMVIGGLAKSVVFSDEGARLVPEIWDPESSHWRSNLAAMQVPRTYHSIALLLPDGRVLAGGGGLCGGCSVNHPNVEIYSPPYLFNGNDLAVRPELFGVSDSAAYGSTVSVQTDSAVSAFSLVRLSSVTHSTNNDQRRIPLQSSTLGGNLYDLDIPNSRGVVPPGYYMLFAMNSAGTPSVASMIKIGGDEGPAMTSPTPGTDVSGTSVTFNWDAGSWAVDNWGVHVGTDWPGTSNFYNSGALGTATSLDVPMPADGTKTYVTLWYRINGLWDSVGYVYRSLPSTGSGPVITSPTPGTDVSGTSVTFNWDADGWAVDNWGVHVGTDWPGTSNFYNSGALGTETSHDVLMPADGTETYVTLWYRVDGVWDSVGYVYNSLPSTGSGPAITSPTPGTDISGTSVTFSWESGGSAVDNWGVHVGTDWPGTSNFYNSGALGTVTSLDVLMPADGTLGQHRLCVRQPSVV